MKKIYFLFLLSLFHFLGHGQEISYDTTYQVTYENGIKDSVIIITKKVMIKEKVYIIDSTENNKWAYDFFICPANLNLTSPSRVFTSIEFTNTNKVINQIGQALGTSLYYKKSNWEWRAGFQFSRNSIKVKSQKATSKQVTSSYFVNDTLDIYYSIDDKGDTLFTTIIDTLEKTKTNTVVENNSNRTSLTVYYLELSLQGGYKMKFGNWNAYLYAGPIIGFLITSKGKDLNTTGDQIEIQEHTFASPIISAQLNFQVAHDIGKKHQLYLEPYFQKFLFTTNNNHSWVNKNDLLGIKFGMKIFL